MRRTVADAGARLLERARSIVNAVRERGGERPRDVRQFEAARAVDWEWDKEHNLQLTPAGVAALDPSLSHGDYVRVRNAGNELRPRIVARLDVTPDREELRADAAGVGMNLRYALGVPVGDPVQVESFDYTRPPPHRRLLRRTLRARPVVCRVRKAVFPDIGFDVCRVPEETMDLLGVEEGDRVVVESAADRTTAKAVAISGGVRERKETQMDQNPSRYPDCAELLDLVALGGTEIDHPAVHLDAKARKALSIDDCPEGGVCQPVRIYRDPTSYFLRAINELTVPVVAALLGVIVVFEPYLELVQLLAIVLLAVAFILLSIVYQGRKAALD